MILYILLYFTVPASVEKVENKVVKEGDNVRVYCNVTAGIPDPTVMWTKVLIGEHIKGNPLNIANISRTQAGEYRCTANNTCGVDSTVVDIDVQCKNIIRLLLLRNLKFFKKGLERRFKANQPISPNLFSCVSSFQVTWGFGNVGWGWKG